VTARERSAAAATSRPRPPRVRGPRLLRARGRGRLGCGDDPFDDAGARRAAADGRIHFVVTVRVPTLSATAADEVADVVEGGDRDVRTPRRRRGRVTRGDHEFDPTVAVAADEITVDFELTEINERRGVDDAGR